MDILIDTHILVYREVNRTIQRRLQEVLRIISELNYRLVVHPLSVTEVEKDKNIPDKSALSTKIRTYPSVIATENPADDDAFLDLIGKPKNEREKVDSCMLYFVYKKGVDFFLTEDPDIKAKAEQLGISRKVMNLKEALSFFKRKLKERETKGGSAPVFCFYKKESKWYIGEKGKESIFDDLKGFEFIHFLLSRENKDLEPRTVYHGEKSMANEFTGRDILLGGEELKDLHEDSPLYIKNLDAKGMNKIKERICQLQEASDLIREKLDSLSDPETIIELNILFQ
jgi:rRNA-processing protein FCF1